MPSLTQHIEAGNRAFGIPQSWSAKRRGLGGELLIADLLTAQVNRMPGGSCLFLGLDLGSPNGDYDIVPHDSRRPLRGHGGDIDAALFVREYREPSRKYGSSRRGLQQDHLVLIDSKQYSGEWERDHHFERAASTLEWLRYTMGHPQLLGTGSDPTSLRISYHFSHTGSWVPSIWLRTVENSATEVRPPDFEWWNSADDLVLESPMEVLLGQLAVLVTFANPDYRSVVPRALWQMLPEASRTPYKS